MPVWLRKYTFKMIEEYNSKSPDDDNTKPTPKKPQHIMRPSIDYSSISK